MQPDTPYPVALTAWRQTGSLLASTPDDALAEDWNAVGWLLVGMAGHGGHGGWTFDPASQVTQCACGKDPFAPPLPVFLVWDGTPESRTDEGRDLAMALVLAARCDGHGDHGELELDKVNHLAVCPCRGLAYELGELEGARA